MAKRVERPRSCPRREPHRAAHARELERMNGLVRDLLALARLDCVTDETDVQAQAAGLVEVMDEVAESSSARGSESRDVGCGAPSCRRRD